MELHNKPCIISVGIGAGYAAGIDRLERSLLFNGWLGDTMFWKDYPEGCPAHKGEGQYNFKVYAFNEAFKKGYKVVLWLDASFYAIKDPMPIFDYINEHGLYFFKSGYPLSATATDSLLFGLTREEFVDVPEFATGAVGINIDNPNGVGFFKSWERLMRSGYFGGSRNHDKDDSEHHLFKFSRQDQSAASMVLYGMKITTAGEDKNWVSYYPNKTDDTLLFIKGI
jgi:hypothetical protein